MGRLAEGGWKISFSLLCFTLILTLVGCSDGPSAGMGEGYILEVTDDRILVIEEKLEGQWQEVHREYRGEAIWLRTKKSGLKPGQQVRYWIRGGVNESYPAQASAKKIEVISD